LICIYCCKDTTFGKIKKLKDRKNKTFFAVMGKNVKKMMKYFYFPKKHCIFANYLKK